MKNLCFLVVLYIVFKSLSFGATSRSNEIGKVVELSVEAGLYLQYVPKSIDKKPRFLVLIHGMIMKDGDEKRNAEGIIGVFKKIAEKKKVVLIAPMFNQTNFGGNHGPMGGYRCLEGRYFGSDEFVNQIMDRYKSLIGGYDGRFRLLGHSAGGQFVSRYVQKHPERVISAAAVAASSYFHPKKDQPYPHGYAHSVGTNQWPGDPVKQFDFKTTEDQIKKFVAVPMCAVVGDNDPLKIYPAEGHIGNTRISYAKGWIQSIEKYANDNKIQHHAKFILVKGGTHWLDKLISPSVDFLFSH